MSLGLAYILYDSHVRGQRALEPRRGRALDVEQQGHGPPSDKTEYGAVHLLRGGLGEPSVVGCKRVESPQALAVALGCDDRLGAQTTCQTTCQRVGPADVTRQHRYHVVPGRVDADHGGVGVLVGHEGQDGAHAYPHGADKDYGAGVSEHFGGQL